MHELGCQWNFAWMKKCKTKGWVLYEYKDVFFLGHWMLTVIAYHEAIIGLNWHLNEGNEYLNKVNGWLDGNHVP